LLLATAHPEKTSHSVVLEKGSKVEEKNEQ
jgi:hypothetical protein